MDSFSADRKSHLAAQRHLILVKITQTNGLYVVHLIWAGFLPPPPPPGQEEMSINTF